MDVFGVPRGPLLGDDARSASADTESSTTYRPASSGSGGGVTPELVLVDPELAQAQRQTKNGKAAMSSTEPANTFPEPAQPAPMSPPPAEPSMRDVPLGTLIFRSTIFHVRHLAHVPLQHLQTVAAMSPLAVRFNKRGTVMIVQCRFQRERRLGLHRALHSTLSAVTIPDTIVESKLDLLLHIPWKIVGRHPTGVNIKGSFALIIVAINNSHLN